MYAIFSTNDNISLIVSWKAEHMKCNLVCVYKIHNIHRRVNKQLVMRMCNAFIFELGKIVLHMTFDVKRRRKLHSFLACLTLFYNLFFILCLFFIYFIILLLFQFFLSYSFFSPHSIWFLLYYCLFPKGKWKCREKSVDFLLILNAWINKFICNRDIYFEITEVK